MQRFIDQVKSGRSLSASEVAWVVDLLVQEVVAVEQKADFLSALALKGETADEIAAMALALREKALVPQLFPETRAQVILDVCGTGGDHMNTFNVSTAVALMVSAHGITVAKHGNRAITSQSGSADVLEALGIRTIIEPQEAGVWLRDYGFAFFFAPHYHPAFKHIGPARRLCAERGLRTVFNFLGPLLNPVKPSAQLMGVPNRAWCPMLAQVMRLMGVDRGWVVSGSMGEGYLDELSLAGPTTVASFGSSEDIHQSEISSHPFVDAAISQADVKGGTASQNAEIILGIFRGLDRGPRRLLVQLNAGAALAVAGAVPDLLGGWQTAGRLLDDGRALEQLTKLQAASRLPPKPAPSGSN